MADNFLNQFGNFGALIEQADKDLREPSSLPFAVYLAFWAVACLVSPIPFYLAPLVGLCTGGHIMWLMLRRDDSINFTAVA